MSLRQNHTELKGTRNKWMVNRPRSERDRLRAVAIRKQIWENSQPGNSQYIIFPTTQQKP